MPAILGSPGLAQDTDAIWHGGPGMGAYGAKITHGPGNEIRVICNNERTAWAESKISFLLGGGFPSGDTVILTFDNEDPVSVWTDRGIINTGSRAGAGNYEWIVGLLREHGSVHVLFPESATNARFTLRGSSSAILPAEQCLMDLFRS